MRPSTSLRNTSTYRNHTNLLVPSVPGGGRRCRVPIMARRNETEEERAARKAAAKASKAEKRASRQGLGDPAKGRKPCSLCGRTRDLLIRCQVDPTLTWHMACGKCWMTASGGEVDGSKDRPYYRYGGLWKNHHQAASGRNKVPAAARAGLPKSGDGDGVAAADAPQRAARGVGTGRRRKSAAAELREAEGGVADQADQERAETGGSGSASCSGSDDEGASEEPGGGARAGVGARAERGRPDDDGRSAAGANVGGVSSAVAAAGVRAMLLAEAARCQAEDG